MENTSICVLKNLVCRKGRNYSQGCAAASLTWFFLLTVRISPLDASLPRSCRVALMRATSSRMAYYKNAMSASRKHLLMTLVYSGEESQAR